MNKLLKYGIKISFIVLVFGSTMIFSVKKKIKKENPKLLFSPVVIYAKRPSEKYTVRGDLKKFLHRMALVESGNNVRATNRYGMIGKYQFSPRTLKEIGIHTTNGEFLDNESLQDSAMVKYMKSNADELRPVIREFSGKNYRGVYVTKSGILAAAHLTGTVGVLSFFYPDKYHHKISDSNGTTVAMYMEKFNNYQINF